MNVQHDLRSGASWQPGGKDEKVGHRVDMDQIVVFAEMLPRQQKRRARQKTQQLEQIGNSTLLTVLASLDTKYLDPFHNILGCLAFFSQTDEIYFVTPFDQGSGILPHAAVQLIECVTQHANAHWRSSRRYSRWRDGLCRSVWFLVRVA